MRTNLEVLGTSDPYIVPAAESQSLPELHLDDVYIDETLPLYCCQNESLQKYGDL